MSQIINCGDIQLVLNLTPQEGNVGETTENLEEFEIPEMPYIDPNWDLMTQIKMAPPKGWESVFQEGIDSMAFSTIFRIVGGFPRVFPLYQDMFRCFHLCSLSRVKVVIIGQDPYPGVMYNGLPKAIGMSFSLRREDSEIAASLKNIYTEIKNEYPDEFEIPNHGDLTAWAHQGVLLLNKCLTFAPGTNPTAGQKRFWMSFINIVINAVVETNPDVIFVLWGSDAQEIGQILGNRVTKLESAHPSPMSAKRGFFGNGHFRKINEILVAANKKPIDWNLP